VRERLGDQFRQRSESSRWVFSGIGVAVLVVTSAACARRPGDKLGQIGGGKMGSEKEARSSSQCEVNGEVPESDVETWVPVSVREARRAPARREDLWPYVRMNFVSMILLFGALAIASYRIAAQSCR
jgi:hypothetical protein